MRVGHVTTIRGLSAITAMRLGVHVESAGVSRVFCIVQKYDSLEKL